MASSDAGSQSSNKGNESAACDLLDVAEKLVKEMAELEDYYFGADKAPKLQAAATKAISIVDGVLDAGSGTQVHKRLRQRAFYLKGRAFSLQPGMESVAEEFLTKAVKLNPQFLDAWNVLGEVYWNLQDFRQAQQCLEQAIEQCGANAVSSRSLSMVLRALEGGKDGTTGDATSRAKNFARALDLAKEAVQLDLKDPQNWETLGNAYVGHFFVCKQRPDEINRALAAYAKAETAYVAQGKRNPFLHLNRGIAAKYVEDYNLALRSFQVAHEIGAASAAEEAQRVVELVQKLAGYADKKGGLKVSRLRELKANFPNGTTETCTLRDLQQHDASADANSTQSSASAGRCLAGRVVLLLDRKGDVPVIVVCCDSSGDFFALSMYDAEFVRVAEAIVPMKSVLFIKHAKLRQITVAGPGGKNWSYPSICSSNPADIHVHGAGSLASAAVQSVFFGGAEKVEVVAPEPVVVEDLFAEKKRKKRSAAKKKKKKTTVVELLPRETGATPAQDEQEEKEESEECEENETEDEQEDPRETTQGEEEQLEEEEQGGQDKRDEQEEVEEQDDQEEQEKQDEPREHGEEDECEDEEDDNESDVQEAAKKHEVESKATAAVTVKEPTFCKRRRWSEESEESEEECEIHETVVVVAQESARELAKRQADEESARAAADAKREAEERIAKANAEAEAEADRRAKAFAAKARAEAEGKRKEAEGKRKIQVEIARAQAEAAARRRIEEDAAVAEAREKGVPSWRTLHGKGKNKGRPPPANPPSNSKFGTNSKEADTKAKQFPQHGDASVKQPSDVPAKEAKTEAAQPQAKADFPSGTDGIAPQVGGMIADPNVRARVTKALVSGLRTLLEAELGTGASSRIPRVEKMYELVGRGEVHEEENENGCRYAPGFIEGLLPNRNFHDLKDSPWTRQLSRHWKEIRDELRRHNTTDVWESGAWQAASEFYGNDWKIAGVLTADKWQNEDRWRRTSSLVRALDGVEPFEVFFARMPPHTTIKPHSDNLNYILTSHLGLDLEEGACAIKVGNDEREWREGEMMVFDTTYMHSTRNDSDRSRYVLVLRFWHPGLSREERRAIHLAHAILAATSGPKGKAAACGR
eukprot:TRINITY_DN27612_c0_g2_i1.p1 TRINITY_DN27612_c0_g2~~TRINITY_DN27612_c0_g2_i1.p1  ORF type:complete len:1107 (+),score=258.45 TRINITY_DN27612_c0_g2_i1:27-3323(+)